MTTHEKDIRWFRPHPWHGIDPGPDVPATIRVFVEITPFDTVKYEIDKTSGFLKVDRPQRTSALPPAAYGFVPRTVAGASVGSLMAGAAGGDRDPLDVMVVAERPLARAEVLLMARVVGGIPMLDGGLADDKIVAVLVDDSAWGSVEDISELPRGLVDRYRHYFATYKSLPGEEEKTRVGPAYGRDHACEVVSAAIADYRAEYGGGPDGTGVPARDRGGGT